VFFRETFCFIVERWTMKSLVTKFEIANSVWTTKKAIGGKRKSTQTLENITLFY